MYCELQKFPYICISYQLRRNAHPCWCSRPIACDPAKQSQGTVWATGQAGSTIRIIPGISSEWFFRKGFHLVFWGYNEGFPVMAAPFCYYKQILSFLIFRSIFCLYLHRRKQHNSKKKSFGTRGQRLIFAA